jgi:PAS domain-containing protein
MALVQSLRGARSSARPQVITIPSWDEAFRDHVATVETASPDAAALERRLRRIFPLVVVRERAVSGDAAWYVYRDGRWRPPDGMWWDDPALPRLVVAPDGWLIDVNRTAADLLDIDSGTVREHHFTDFIVPGTLEDSVTLFRVIESGRTLDATIRLRPQTGSTIAVELHAQRGDAGVIGVFRLATDVEAVADDAAVPGPESVTTLPSTDVAFRGYVLRALARMPEPTPDGLAMRLRRLYPHASTTSDGKRWIARRDPEATDGPATPWWNDPGLPRVRYDAQALILETNPAAEALFGRELVGHHWQEFVLPGTTEEVAVMLEILGEVGAAESRFRMPRADGALIEFDSYTLVEGEDLVTVMRQVDVRPAAEATPVSGRF